jgi:hypothetical protein
MVSSGSARRDRDPAGAQLRPATGWRGRYRLARAEARRSTIAAAPSS